MAKKTPVKTHLVDFLGEGNSDYQTAVSIGLAVAAATEPDGEPIGDIIDSSIDLVTITPAQLTADVDDWDGLDDPPLFFARLSSDASWRISGYVAPATERLGILANVGAEDIVLGHLDAGSVAANQIECPGAVDLTLAPGAAVWITYDLEDQVWRIVGGTGGGSSTELLSIEPILSGGGVVVPVGSFVDIEVPFDATVMAVRQFAAQAGAIVTDIRKASGYAGFPTFTSICAAAKPTIAATNQKSQDSTLTGWTTAIAAGDVLRFIVESVTTIQQVTVSLTIRRD